MTKALALENFWNLNFLKTKKHSVNKIAKQDEHSIRFWFSVSLIAVNAILLMSYIYGVNAYASQGYEITALQTRLASLNTDNSKINLQVSEAGSMVSIQTDYLSANFVPAGTSKFLEVPQTIELTQR